MLPITIMGVHIEVAYHYRYSRKHLNSGMDYLTPMLCKNRAEKALFSEETQILYCREMLELFYQSVMVGAISSAV